MTEPGAGASVEKQTSDPRGASDYAAAIYGSLLAASTVLGAAASRTAQTSSADLLAALLVTSMVFFLLHLFVRVIGRELPLQTPWRAATRRAAHHELPILWAVLPPAAVVLAALLLDEPADRVGWSALLVAIGGQVFWTWLAVREAGISRPAALLSLAVSTALGLVLIAFKLLISH